MIRLRAALVALLGRDEPFTATLLRDNVRLHERVDRIRAERERLVAVVAEQESDLALAQTQLREIAGRPPSTERLRRIAEHERLLALANEYMADLSADDIAVGPLESTLVEAAGIATALFTEEIDHAR